jgi:hypothetical protein
MKVLPLERLIGSPPVQEFTQQVGHGGGAHLLVLIEHDSSQFPPEQLNDPGGGNGCG